MGVRIPPCLLILDTSHFTGKGSNFGKNHVGGFSKLKAKEILVYDRNNGRRENVCRLKRALLEVNMPYCCAICSLFPIWNDKKLVLHVDHIDGNFLNNTKSNLRFLCPNCHSQTETFGVKNIKGRNG